MRLVHLLIVIFLLGPVAAMPALPSLKLFENGAFAPGRWTFTPFDADARLRSPGPRSQCLSGTQALIHAGHAGAGAACAHTVVENLPDRATVTYVCRGEGYGRTEIRRIDTNRFVVAAQGISGREPFEMRGEYHRVGACDS